MTPDWLAPDALVIPVDYATMCSAEVVIGAALFLVDERGQFESIRAAGQFDDYPDPGATLGEAILAGTPRPANGRVVVTTWGSAWPTSSSRTPSSGVPRRPAWARSWARDAVATMTFRP